MKVARRFIAGFGKKNGARPSGTLDHFLPPATPQFRFLRPYGARFYLGKYLTVRNTGPSSAPSFLGVQQIFVVEKSRFVLDKILNNGQPFTSTDYIQTHLGKMLFTVEGN